MATTKIWTVKDSLQRVLNYAANPAKTETSGGLAQARHYAENEGKTTLDETAQLVTGLHCRADRAWADMRAVQERFGKTDKTAALHAYQSFAPGEVTPEQCHAIGLELARRVWGGRFQVLVATHLNTDCLHNHFVISSVSYVDGIKYEQRRSQYAELREASDEICRRYKLSVIEQPQGKTPRALYEAERRGEPTRYDQMRNALQQAMRQTSNEQDFARVLLHSGYRWQRDPHRKYVTLQPVDGGQAVRLYRLGAEYDWPAIAARLTANYRRHGPHLYGLHFDPKYNPERRTCYRYHGRVRCKGSLRTAGQKGGLWRLYLYYCYQLGIYPKSAQPRVNWPEIRALWRDTDRMLAELNFVNRHNIKTTAEIVSYRAALAADLQALAAERDHCTRLLRRKDTPPGLVERRTALTQQITALRKEDKTARAVLARVNKTSEHRRLLYEPLSVPRSRHRERER